MECVRLTETDKSETGVQLQELFRNIELTWCINGDVGCCDSAGGFGEGDSLDSTYQYIIYHISRYRVSQKTQQ